MGNAQRIRSIGVAGFEHSLGGKGGEKGTTRGPSSDHHRNRVDVVLIGTCPPALELHPLTKVQSEDLGVYKTDRCKDAIRSKIMHTIDDIKGGGGFSTILKQQRASLDTKGVDLTDLFLSQETLESNGTCLVDRSTALQDELPGLKRLEFLRNKRFFSRPSVILIHWHLKRLSKVSPCLAKKKCNGRGSQHSNASHTGRNKASSHS